MISDSWSKEKRQQFDIEYSKLFGGQVRAMKSLYKNKKDLIFLEDLLNNISNNIYQTLMQNQLEMAEAFLERMFLSSLDYEVVVMNSHIEDEFSIYVYFYNDFHTIEYDEIRIKNVEDVKMLIELIMYVGNVYHNLARYDEEIDINLPEYQFHSGFKADVSINMERSEEIEEPKRFYS
ncbi:hypothetical protein [Peloplasma aerotolerans]|uniref:Uncharacterized protein n=1 Tax=Peloplasma aerotolerans TaxID=3044389 RepID=A0AAW6U3Z0_9MOLU|nr:hypothetical protein [Mariniplasma sp. M4Ah]MDI6452693.1 hypothetical protein [Mariniplasma sp. M4Ah]